jgi:hypothetical protein
MNRESIRMKRGVLFCVSLRVNCESQARLKFVI